MNSSICIANRRRDLLLAIATLSAAAPLAGIAQQAQGVRRIGFIGQGGEQADLSRWYRGVVVKALRSLGYEEGGNLIVEWRYAEGRVDRVEGLVREAIRSNVELIMAPQQFTIAAIRKASTTMPVVMLGIGDPVENGLIDSIEKPGGSVTGSASSNAQTAAGLFQTVREAKPGASALALLHGAMTPASQRTIELYGRQAKASGLSMQSFMASSPDEVASTLDRIAASRPDVMVVFTDGAIIPRIGEVAAFVADRKVFAVSNISLAVDRDAAVLAYSANFVALTETGIGYVDRILRGAKPADLPVALPSKYDVILNRKVARAIGYEAPPALAGRVTRVIE